MEIKRTQEEIDAVLNAVVESQEEWTRWHGMMSYEQGVKAALMWITGQNNDNPMAGWMFYIHQKARSLGISCSARCSGTRPGGRESTNRSCTA